jgi:hypothetical protein
VAAAAVAVPAAAGAAGGPPVLGWAPATAAGNYNYGTLNAGQTAAGRRTSWQQKLSTLAGSGPGPRQPNIVSGDHEDMLAGELEAPSCTLIPGRCVLATRRQAT